MTSSKKWKLGEDSMSKMIIWFQDGNIRTMYSLDWKHKHSKTRDKALGLERFRKLNKTYGTLAKTAEIYDKATGQRIAQFHEGTEKPLESTKQ